MNSLGTASLFLTFSLNWGSFSSETDQKLGAALSRAVVARGGPQPGAFSLPPSCKQVEGALQLLFKDQSLSTVLASQTLVHEQMKAGNAENKVVQL